MAKVHREYYMSGKLQSEVFILNGKKEGEFKFYYENVYESINFIGQLCKICNYTDNKLNGEYKEYYMNGQLYKICNYINDKINGEYKEYYINGQLRCIFYYDNGRKISFTPLQI